MPGNPANFEERLVIAVDTFAAIIAADPYFPAAPPLPAIPVLTERIGDINQTIAAALSKIGAGVIVIAPDADSLVRRGETLAMRVRIVAQVSELVLINQGATGSKKPALSIACRIMKAVDRKPNGLDIAGAAHRSGLNEFLLDDDQPFRLRADPRSVVYQVSAFTTVDL